MSNESRAVYFEHKYIVDNPYITALHELHLALMSQCVYREAHTVACINMSRLGDELDVKRMPPHLGGGLRMHVARDEIPAARVYPLPFLGICPQIGV